MFGRGSDGTWSQVAKLVADDAEAGDYFGSGCAISGDFAVVGAMHDEPTGAGDSSGPGAAYIFGRNADGSWSQTAKLVADDAAAYPPARTFANGSRRRRGRDVDILVETSRGDAAAAATWKLGRDRRGLRHDEFGYVVAIDGDRVVVGANGNDDGGSASGSAYTFQRNADGSWLQTAKLVADDAAAVDTFGWSVGISGPYAVVGAYQDDDGGDDNFHNSGSAYLFGTPSPAPAPTAAAVTLTGTISVSGISLAVAQSRASVFVAAIAASAGVDESKVTVSFSAAARRRLADDGAEASSSAAARRLTDGVEVEYVIADATNDAAEAMDALTTDDFDDELSTAAATAGATADFANVVTEEILVVADSGGGGGGGSDDDDDAAVIAVASVGAIGGALLVGAAAFLVARQRAHAPRARAGTHKDDIEMSEVYGASAANGGGMA